MGRAPCCDKANVKKGPWSPEEDATLKEYIEKHGTGGNWIALPQKIGLKRCGKSCRLRWLNYLRPNIKHGGFTEEEDNIICSLYISIGSRWSIIAAQLPGRTDNDIKNYWNTRLKKKLLGKRKQTHTNRLSIADESHKDGEEDNACLQNLSSSALERLQLHMQLQSTFSFYNNPALWPKLNPLQDKVMQTLQSLNDVQNTFAQQVPRSPRAGVALLEHRDGRIICNDAQKVDFYEHTAASNGIEQHYSSENHINSMPSSDSSMRFTNPSNMVETSAKPNVLQESSGGDHQNTSTFTRSELDELLNNKVNAFLPSSASQTVAEADWFKEMEGSKDDLLWWSNDFHGSSESLNSWNSSAVPYQTGEIYQNHALGYNML